MRVGISIRSFYPPGDGRALVASMIERAAAARRAGLDSLFVGDHHATPSPYIQNVPILGRLLAEWGEQPAGALFLLPLWDPVLLAEQIGTLASIARGRFIVQCCVGADASQFRALGRNPRHRGRDFERAFEMLRGLLAGERVRRGADGPEIGIAPVPPEAVEYWIGADVWPAIDRAARLADAWLVGPNVPLEDATRLLGDYLARCEGYGRPPRATPIRRNVHVAESEAELERDVLPALARAGAGVQPECVVVGSVERVAEAFRDLAARGFSDVIVRHFHDDPARVRASIERLAEVRRLVRAIRPASDSLSG